ncbi:ATP-binding protein [Rhizobium sp. FKL33]|uniref:ATP-binding protein n=1 Tax=Rhizobium sp. FKL33 TaxID=2562307 RepID=UPI0010C0EC06|nr:ATP-binding protein [Rhizobium sp. FKL33]
MRLKRLLPATIRGQITLIIVMALLVVGIVGRALEQWAGDAAPDIEEIATRVDMVAELLKTASPGARETILASSRAAGWRFSLEPVSVSESFTGPPELDGVLIVIIDSIFPTDNTPPPPVGGWRTFWRGERVIAAKVDSATLLILSGFPDTILNSAVVNEAPYYSVAILVLIAFFFLFAIRVITEPIKRISEAATHSDIANSAEIFEERGPTEIVALAHALNVMRSRIQLMVGTRTRMLRGISHDLRTPLTRLRLRAERMEEGPVREGLLSDIIRIDGLLNEVLKYLRDDYASEPIQRADVASLLQTTCAEFADVGYQVRFEGPNRMIIDCKPLAIMRAVTNLCDNSVKFATEVIVSLQEYKTGCEIAVTDNGPGIPEHLRTQVFEPFFKGDDARGQGQEGFGLGLSIVADIVHAHHGALSLTSNAPNGLVFKIFIPGPVG